MTRSTRLGPRSAASSARLVVRVGIRAVLDHHGRREKIEPLAKDVHQVSRVGVWYGRGLVPVDDDSRRVAATLMSVPQLDPSAVYERRLVYRQGVLQRPCQLFGLHLSQRRL